MLRVAALDSARGRLPAHEPLLLPLLPVELDRGFRCCLGAPPQREGARVRVEVGGSKLIEVVDEMRRIVEIDELPDVGPEALSVEPLPPLAHHAVEARRATALETP